MLKLKIVEDPLTRKEVADLLNEHLGNMTRHSPPGSVHALAIDKLRSPDITFWTAWAGQHLTGCGALRDLGSYQGEIKSMRTADNYLGKGVATAILHHIVAEARARGYTELKLETGSGKAFEPAHALYLKFGFEFCGPFADYLENPFSRFMSCSIDNFKQDSLN